MAIADRAPPGYHARYLRVDVSQAAASQIPLSEETLRSYLGGVGLGVYILLREQAATIDPLSEDAPLAFVFSPLVGSPLTTSAKFAVVSRSPLTERINDSLASSSFAIAGKKTGYDAIVIVGRAQTPSVLLIDNDEIVIAPADDLWGTSIDAAQSALKDRFDNDYRFAVIGPAGERRVRFATISHDGRHAGRGGSGAVLGAKLIKAIGVRGDRTCRWAAPEKLFQLSKELSRKSMGPATAKYRELGTAANLLSLNRLHALPTRNFQGGQIAAVEQLAPARLEATREKVQASCAACTIGCEHIYSLSRQDNGSAHANTPEQAARGVRIEYENLFALGPLCGITAADQVLLASQRCDELGLDTISTGGTIAFAMECVERGLLEEPWLRFGDGEALIRSIELIARREGIGARLADGSRQLAAWLGRDAGDFAPHVKGLELPGYEPRSMQAMALGFAMGTRGADHNRSGAYEVDLSTSADRFAVDDRAVGLAIAAEDRATIMDSAILCKFVRHVFDDLYSEVAEMLHFVTGWDIDADELLRIAQRIVVDEKRFNIRSGWTPEEDTLPKRFFDERLPQDARGKIAGDRWHNVKRTYNLARGWTDAGWLIDEPPIG